jgi:DNA-binding transcriptional regulator YdaS (Cro superfamily)
METVIERDEALARAIEQAGGPAALARHITETTGEQITTQAISQWRKCPPTRVLQVESAPGVTETRHTIRPDMYPPDQSERAA